MRIAIVHDYIKEYGGAERVLEALHEIFPDAPIFTTVYLPEFLGPHKNRFADWDVRTSWMQKIPYVEKLISPLRLLTPWYFDNIDFSEFDIIITSATGAYFPNLIVKPIRAVHICYCHTPPRYLYGYPTARNWQNTWWGKIAAVFFNHYLRQIDFVSYQRPDYIIANSIEVKRRIEKFYRKDATVIYPPVNIKEQRTKNKEQRKEKKYYLTGGRLARAKRIDLVIQACNRLKLPLKIYGRGFADYGEELQRIAGQTIEFLGEVSEKELGALYMGAEAFIYPAEQEDFGIIPVEAQSYGVPVIALAQGGVLETVIDGKTGVLFYKPSVEDIISAINKLSKLEIKSEDCIENAKKFGKERFKREIKNYVNSKLKSTS